MRGLGKGVSGSSYYQKNVSVEGLQYLLLRFTITGEDQHNSGNNSTERQ